MENVDKYVDKMRLIEMKTTRKPIVSAELRNFFFGATEREYAMAKALGDRYLFAFIVRTTRTDMAGRLPHFCHCKRSSVELEREGFSIK